MAEGKGIRRLVQLILDKASADRLRKDAAEAINKGTDPAKAKKNLSAVDAAFGKLKKAALALGGVLATVFAVRKIVDFGKAAVAAATEAGAIWNRLGQAVENAGHSFEAVRPEIEKTARAMQDVTTVGDEDFASVLTELITVSNDYRGSLENVAVVADLAAAKQIDLRTAAQLVGRAMVGETGTLSRYGIVVQEGADAIEVLRERFRGFAENEAETFAGKLTQLNNEWGDFKQAVGEALIAGAEGESMLDRLTLAVKTLTEQLGILSRAWDGISETFYQNKRGIQSILQGAETSEQALTGLRVFREITEKELAAAEKAVEDFGGAWRQTFSVAFGTWFGEKWQDRRADIDSAKESVEGLRMTLAELDRTMAGLETGTLSVGGSRPPSPSPSSPSSSSAGEADKEEAKTLLDIWKEYPAVMVQVNAELSRAEKMKQGWAGLNSEMEMSAENAAKLEAQMASLGSTSNEQLMLLQNAMASAAYGITNAFAVGFETIFSGMGGLAEAAQGIGLGIVGGLAEGMAQYHTAMGIGKIAEAGWPPNPAALRSGLKHLVAAGLFKALDAMTARAGTKVGSGGAGGAGGGAAALQSGFQGQKVGNEIHIYFDGPGFDAVNPVVQRVVAGAVQNAQELYGPNANVKTYRRPRK